MALDGAPRPLRIVAIGGGTGLSTLLRGLQAIGGAHVELTAIVAVSDDGGSTGRLRLERGGPALGDARACIAALSRSEGWRALLEHRFGGAGSLSGHKLGNLLLAAALEADGTLLPALDRVGRLVKVKGRVLPATEAPVRLAARLADGRIVRGESALADVAGPVERVWLVPEVVPPGPGVLDAIAAADLVVLGPGSLFTSVLAAALPAGVGRALQKSTAPKLLVQNLTMERGQTDEMGVADHVRAVREHLGAKLVDAVLVHRWNGTPPPGAIVSDPKALAAIGVRELVGRVSTDRGRGRQHDALRVADAVLRSAEVLRTPEPRRQSG